MIQITIPGMTLQQRRMLDALWKMDSLQEVQDWILSQPTPALRKEAETMKELLTLACLDQDTGTDVAKMLLDKICR
jgi:hypothetical protein